MELMDLLNTKPNDQMLYQHLTIVKSIIFLVLILTEINKCRFTGFTKSYLQPNMPFKFFFFQKQ